VKSLARTACATVLISGAAAGAALAAHPLKGHECTGTWGLYRYSISFKVGQERQERQRLRAGQPARRPPGWRVRLAADEDRAGLEEGHVQGELPLVFVPTHSTTGSVVVTGTFLRHGRERGKISSQFKSKTCDKTQAYSASTT
jgi:hypothetical protein